MSASGGPPKKKRTEGERRAAEDPGPATRGTVGDAVGSGAEGNLTNARNVPNEDQEEVEEVQVRKEKRRGVRAASLSFEESQKIDPIHKMDQPPDWARKFKHFFFWPVIVSVIGHWLKRLPSTPVTLLWRQDNDVLKKVREQIAAEERRRWAIYQDYVRRPQWREARDRCEEKLTDRHIRMIYEDAYEKIKRQSPEFDIDDILQSKGVPLPPIFCYNDDNNIVHISDKNGDNAIVKDDVEKDFKVSQKSSINISKRYGWEPEAVPDRIHIWTNSYYDLYNNRKYLSSDQLKELRSLQLDEDRKFYLNEQIRRKEAEEGGSAQGLETNLSLINDRLEQYQDARNFFGASRLDFFCRSEGNRVPPVYVQDSSKHYWHFTDLQDHTQQASTKETLKETTPGYYFLDSFKSTYSWIFDAPIEPMTSDYLILDVMTMTLYINLVEAIDELEKSPFQEDDVASKINFLEKFGRKNYWAMDKFEEEHAKRLSDYIHLSPCMVLEMVRRFGKDEDIIIHIDSTEKRHGTAVERLNYIVNFASRKKRILKTEHLKKLAVILKMPLQEVIDAYDEHKGKEAKDLVDKKAAWDESCRRHEKSDSPPDFLYTRYGSRSPSAQFLNYVVKEQRRWLFETTVVDRPRRAIAADQRGQIQPPCSSKQLSTPVSSNAQSLQESVHHCQVLRQKILPDNPIPCTLFNPNCCLPCWLETGIRKLPQLEQNSSRLQMHQKYPDFQQREPVIISDDEVCYKHYVVRKIPFERYKLVEQKIERMDYSDVTGEELMIYMWMIGGKVRDSLVRFAHPVDNGKVIQYHWRHLEDESVTLEILHNAMDLMKTIPNELLTRSRCELVLNQILVSLAEKDRPAYLTNTQLDDVFGITNFGGEQASQFICEWRMEREEHERAWKKTSQDKEVDNLISEVLDGDISGFDLPDREFKEHRRSILEGLHEDIFQNGHKPVLNPLQIRKLSGALGDTVSGIRSMFKQICVQKSSKVERRIENARIILKGFHTEDWHVNFQKTFLEKLFKDILKIGGNLNEDQLDRLVINLPYNKVYKAFEKVKRKWEKNHADKDEQNDGGSEEQSEEESEPNRNDLEYRVRYPVPRSGAKMADLRKRRDSPDREYDVKSSSDSDQESDDDAEIVDDADQVVDESREQTPPRRDAAPCSSGQLSASSTRSGSKANSAEKRLDALIARRQKEKEREKSDADSDGNSDDSGPFNGCGPGTMMYDYWKRKRDHRRENDNDAEIVEDAHEDADESREKTPPRRDEALCSSGHPSASSTRSGSKINSAKKRPDAPRTSPIHKAKKPRIEEESPPKESGDGNTSNGELGYDADVETDEAEPVQRVGNEEMPMEIDHQNQEDNESNEDEPVMPAQIQRIHVPIEAEQPPPDGNQDDDDQEDHDEDGGVRPANDDQDDLQGNDGNPDQHPQPQPVVDRPRRADAAYPSGPIQNAPVVNQAIMAPGPVGGIAEQPLPANQPRRFSARIQDSARRTPQIQAANQLRNRVLPQRASPRQQAFARPQRYRSGQILTPAQANRFVAQNTCVIPVVYLTQAQTDEALGRNRGARNLPQPPRSQVSAAPARAQRTTQRQNPKKSESRRAN